MDWCGRMMLYNITQKTVLARHVKYAGNFFRRFIGLMFKRKFPTSYEALILSPCNSIHTMFMFYPIDVIFLDERLRVLHACQAMRPLRISPVIVAAVQTVELPAGTIAHSGTRIGDFLSLMP